MITRHPILLGTVLGLGLLCTASLQADTPVSPTGKLLFSDDFERNDLGAWKVIIPGFKVEQGKLVGTQDRADHGSVGRVYLPMKDVVMTFRFRLEGSPRFNVVFDDKNHKGSHAGHICRVAFAEKQIRLGDDKEGVMRNDIFEMRRDPARKAAADQIIEGRGTAHKADLKQGVWYNAEIRIHQDTMNVYLDGKPVGSLTSPGIGHPTKESVHFTVSNKALWIDDVRIWKTAE